MKGVVPRRLGRKLCGVLSVACLLAAQCPAVLALARPTPGFSLQVSPARLVIPAGTVSTAQHFQVTNGGRTPYDVIVEKADFTASEKGALNFRPDAPYAASAWVSVDPVRFRMAPGTTRNVTVRITVPAAPEPGDHQLALLFKVPARRDAGNLRINRVIAAPVFITVPGSIDSSVEVTDLRAPGFVMDGPVPITTRIHDFGTVHRDFRGTGRLHVRVGGSDLTFPDFTVLRGSTREVSTRWNPPLMCVCHATVSIPGPGEGAHTATVRIVVFPLHLLVVLLVAMAALLLLGWHARRRYRAKVLAAALHRTEDGSHF
ncbi:hypothetical protein OG589_29155 [Sphaerisporangium sp. NBC_01403]|uniref:hypothetical protein n=1 Tax=Sphaerisporangium sp. NBC_01403 TaxID=2903599 RepID=UPI003243BB6C